MSRYMPYRVYKNSGMDWLGDVPEGWKLRKTKWLFDIQSRQPKEDDEIVTAFRDGVVTLRSNRRVVGFTNSEKEIGYQGVRVNDLVIHAMDAFAGAIGVSDSNGKSTPVYSICRAHDESVSPHYYGRLLRTMALSGYISSLAKGIRERSTEFRWKEAGNLFLPLPPIAEQHQINAFLDRETAKLDNLIGKQEKLIEILQEKRQALITHAVTKGLNRDVPMKDSGVEWLGEVPEHWKIVSIRRIIRKIEQGWSPECLGRPAEQQEWGVMKSGCVNRGIFVEAENKALPETLSPLPEYEIHAGDVLMSRASGSPDLIGSMALVKSIRPQLMLSDKIFRLHTWATVTSEFLVYTFNASVLRAQIGAAISGADGLANNLPQSAIRAFICALPPTYEQIGIVAYLDRETTKLDTLIEKSRRSIDLMREHRTALISAAVTGKIDVRDAA